MLLGGKGLYSLTAASDPATILWENLGTPLAKVIRNQVSFAAVSFVVLSASYFGLYSIHYFEYLRNLWVRSDCTGQSYYAIDDAFNDHLLDDDKQQGLMECYCEQIYETYGDRALNILFEDGERYCQ